MSVVLDALYVVVGAGLCVLVLVGWWWEAEGRRAWERDLARRNRAEYRDRPFRRKTPPRRRSP